MKLDFDIEDFYTVKDIIANRVFVFLQLSLYPSQVFVHSTKRGYHVQILVSSSEVLSDFDIAFIQALLGDDFKRATFNYQRAKQGVKGWNTLFTKNEKYCPAYSKALQRILKRRINAVLRRRKHG